MTNEPPFAKRVCASASPRLRVAWPRRTLSISQATLCRLRASCQSDVGARMEPALRRFADVLLGHRATSTLHDLGEQIPVGKVRQCTSLRGSARSDRAGLYLRLVS